MKQVNEDADLVEELLDIESGLTEWEVEFVESLARWMDNHSSLTYKQRSKAEDIAQRIRRAA